MNLFFFDDSFFSLFFSLIYLELIFELCAHYIRKLVVRGMEWKTYEVEKAWRESVYFVSVKESAVIDAKLFLNSLLPTFVYMSISSEWMVEFDQRLLQRHLEGERQRIILYLMRRILKWEPSLIRSQERSHNMDIPSIYDFTIFLNLGLRASAPGKERREECLFVSFRPHLVTKVCCVQ